jgi:hypothetical protein
MATHELTCFTAKRIGCPCFPDNKDHARSPPGLTDLLRARHVIEAII